MIAVVQRVSRAAVAVEAENYRAEIGPGLCVLLCAEVGDGDGQSQWMAGKLARLRIFRDENDKMNRSVQDIVGEMLVISQFTLAGDCSKGNRPSFINAAGPQDGERLYLDVCRRLREEHSLPVKTGIFGAMMEVEIHNDGPVTLIVQTDGAGGAERALPA
jgi:D-tyrosyl-tRNA(Tyr) deacylase